MSHASYTDKLRVRSCGLLVEENKLLLVELHSPVTKSWVWLPPGGGVEFGESLRETVVREFEEETGLKISVQHRVHINEIIKPPVHAIEFYFRVKRLDGILKLGKDPEMDDDHQLIRNIGFFSQDEMESMHVAPPFLKTEFWDKLQRL
jgi:8-oxo-dGTP diphosphatase